MKTLYLTDTSANIVVDQEANTCGSISRDVESIRSVYVIDEPMHVIYQAGEYRRELDVEKDDIVVVFYSREFPNKIVVAKSADWVSNIRTYREAEQKRKEEWATKQAIADIKGCDCCCTCCPA